MTAIVVVGASHHTAPVAVRERLSLTPTLNRCLVASIVASGDADEAVAISTCNRTELYLAGPRADALAELGLAELRAAAGEQHPVDDAVFRTYRGDAAVRHLFRVAAGLDSMVPGEAEIIGQVREALALARSERGAGAILSRLFESAIEAGRRVRTDTAIGQSNASVASVAAEAAREALGSLDDARVLVIGAGQTAELVISNLVARGAAEVRVANRTLARAGELAERFAGTAVPIESLPRQLVEADVVITATNAPHAILTPAMVAATGRTRPLSIIDLAVPRDVDPAVAGLCGVTLIDLDTLERTVSRNVDSRRREAVAGEAIVATQAETFRRWLVSLDVVPAITGLRAFAEAIRSEELARLDGRWEALTPRDRELVERLTRTIVNKLLHEPTVRMRDLAADEDPGELARTVGTLFDLGLP